MTTVMDAYNRLLDLATRGREFSVKEVFNEIAYGNLDPKSTYGTGYDFETTITIPDIVRNRTVRALVRLRVVKTRYGALLLRTRMVWTPSDGEPHSSYAYYEISPEAAEDLALESIEYIEGTEEELLIAALQTTGEMFLAAFEMIFARPKAHAPYKTAWSQVHAGTYYDKINPTLAARHAKYHSDVIHRLADEHTAVTCMLSDTDTGRVEPANFPALLGWVETQLAT